MPGLPLDPFDLVRTWFGAFNRDDVGALISLYHEECETQHGERSCRSRHEQRQLFEEMFSATAAGFENGARRTLRSLARIETGAMHAEWRGRERDRDTGAVLETAAYDEFVIEAGLIRQQRTVLYPMATAPDQPLPDAPPTSRRIYPLQPIVGVGAVIVSEGRVLLVKRRFEPLAGQWSLPGGKLELGETLEAGLAREMLEETGLEVEVGPVIEVFDRILLDPEKRVRFHFVLIDYLCRPVGGTLAHGSDVDAAIFVEPTDLARYQLTAKALAVIHRGLELVAAPERASG